MWEVVPGVIAAALSGWALYQGRKDRLERAKREREIQQNLDAVMVIVGLRGLRPPHKPNGQSRPTA